METNAILKANLEKLHNEKVELIYESNIVKRKWNELQAEKN